MTSLFLSIKFILHTEWLPLILLTLKILCVKLFEALVTYQMQHSVATGWNWSYKKPIYMLVWQYLYICIFLYYVSLNWFYWYMKVLQSSTIFKQRNNHVKCPAIKIFARNFLQLPLEKYNCNSTHSAIEKLELTFLLILYFHDFNYGIITQGMISLFLSIKLIL